MSEESRNPGSDLDAGLEAAFGAPEERGASILKRIERLTGVKSQLILHDAPGEESPLTYVHRLEKDDESAEDDSRYQIAGEIAKGGVGVIYKGRDRDLGRDVALKVLRRAHAGNPEVFHRFVEEAQIGGQLQHPGIVPVYSLGLQPDGRPCFAMKLVKGRTLAAALKERKSPAEDRRTLLRTFERICQTMAYAHARGVIHRDLKPSNVMLGAFGEVLVVDWGFGKVLGRPEPEKPEVERTVVTTVRSEDEGSASIAGSVMGTPAYMPPEQALGHVADLDEQTDVFALGAILTEILTGRPPYVGEAKDLLVMASQARLGDALERLVNCDADPEVAALAKRCVEPMRSDRPVNAGEVAEEIGRLLTQAEERAHAAEIDAVRERSRVKQAQGHARWERRAKRLTIGLAAAILLAIAAGGGFYLSEDSKRRERTAKARPKLEQAIEEVSRLTGQGRWAEALAVARKAEHLASDLDDGAREQAVQLVRKTEAGRAAAEAEAAQAEKDRKLLAELEEIQLKSLDDAWNPRLTDADYASAFRRYGAEPGSPAFAHAAARARARGSDFATAVASALDDWFWIRRKYLEAAGTDSGVLLDASRVLDPDPVQGRLRELLAALDVEGLVSLASEGRAPELPRRSQVLLGIALQDLGRGEIAIPLLEAVALRNPGDVWAHYYLGWALFQNGRFEESLTRMTAVLALRPRSAVAHNALGVVLCDGVQDYASAAQVFRAAAALAPGWAMIHANLGNALIGIDRLDEAIASYHKALEEDPRYAKAHAGLGRALFKKGLIDQAVVAWSNAARFDDRNAQIWNGLGCALQAAGQREEAIEAFENALEIDPTFEVALTNLTAVLHAEGRHERALEVARRAVEVDPDEPGHLSNLSAALRALGRYEEAVEAARQAIRLDGNRAGSYINLGNALSGQGKLDAAVDAFRRAARLDRDHPEPCFNLGNTFFGMGEMEQSAEAYREAIQREPRHARAHLGLAQALYLLGRLEQAVGEFRAAIRLDVKDPRALQSLGSVLHMLGRYSEALEAHRAAVAVTPEVAQVHCNLGMTLAALGRTEDSIAEYREAVRLDPELAEAHCNLAFTLARQGKFDEALPLMRRGHRLGSLRPDWPYPSAQWVKSHERFVALAKRLPAILAGEVRPADAEEAVELGEMCLVTRQCAAASRFFAEAFAADPDLRRGRLHNAACAAALCGAGRGKDAEALSDEERAAWREQARTWLSAELDAPHSFPRADYLRYVLRTPDFAGVRDDAELAKLPEAERKAWRAFWDEVRQALAKARGED